MVIPQRLFLPPSDNFGSVITSMPLTKKNYNEWAFTMLNALRVKKKTNFVDDTLSKLVVDSSDLESWISVNSMVVG